MKIRPPTIALALALTALYPVLAGDTPEHVINQKDREFSTNQITIKPGEQVVFKNNDNVTHNVFSNSKINPFHIKIQQPGHSSTVQFTNEGVTEVRCAIHPKMKLMVTVKP
jgi:plastocyanin